MQNEGGPSPSLNENAFLKGREGKRVWSYFVLLKGKGQVLYCALRQKARPDPAAVTF